MYTAYESPTFLIRSPEWKFSNTLWIRNRVDAKSGKFTVNIQDGAERNVIAFFWTSVSSVITYTGLNYATRWLDILNLLPMSDGLMSRIGRRKQVKRAS